jgi:hypothetical protein
VVAELEWGRVRNETGFASVNVPYVSNECGVIDAIVTSIGASGRVGALFWKNKRTDMFRLFGGDLMKKTLS